MKKYLPQKGEYDAFEVTGGCYEGGHSMTCRVYRILHFNRFERPSDVLYSIYEPPIVPYIWTAGKFTDYVVKKKNQLKKSLGFKSKNKTMTTVMMTAAAPHLRPKPAERWRKEIPRPDNSLPLEGFSTILEAICTSISMSTKKVKKSLKFQARMKSTRNSQRKTLSA